MGKPKVSSNIDSARGNSMAMQNGYIEEFNTLRSVQKRNISIMVHHNLGTAVRYLSQLAIPQLRHNIIVFSIIMKIGYETYLVLHNLDIIIK